MFIACVIFNSSLRAIDANAYTVLGEPSRSGRILPTQPNFCRQMATKSGNEGISIASITKQISQPDPCLDNRASTVDAGHKYPSSPPRALASQDHAAGNMSRNVVVIIGTGGMGLAIARRLGSGSHLVLADYSQDQLDSATETLREEGHSVYAIQTDVCRFDLVQNLAQQASQLGNILAIAHTAGVSPVQASEDKIYQVDLLGTAHVIDAFLSVASINTSLVVIASLAGHQAKGALSGNLENHLATAPADKLLGHPELAPPSDLQENALRLRAYNISKRANIVRVQASAATWGQKGARINSVSPGLISTAMGHQEMQGPLKEQLRDLVENSAVRRVGTPSDIANIVAFLCSQEASFITGEDILMDGGWASSKRWVD